MPITDDWEKDQADYAHHLHEHVHPDVHYYHDDHDHDDYADHDDNVTTTIIYDQHDDHDHDEHDDYADHDDNVTTTIMISIMIMIREVSVGSLAQHHQ